jgi:hypothetical protein
VGISCADHTAPFAPKLGRGGRSCDSTRLRTDSHSPRRTDTLQTSNPIVSDGHISSHQGLGSVHATVSKRDYTERLTAE